MPQRPDGKAARVERVTFTRPAADRIAKAVRAVEADAASSQGPTLGYRLDGGPAGKLFRVCTFTGAWSTNSSKTVTFKYQTTTPNTVSATNLFFPIDGTSTRDCAIAKDGTAWFLVDVPFETATAVFFTGTTTQTVVSDITLSASLNTNNCSITVNKTLTTASVTIVTGTSTSSYLRIKA
jgi:hypothetical protein